jgi:uncharacterized membrane protein YeaQ/YmgE (transglycosylase-associated protein family)
MKQLLSRKFLLTVGCGAVTSLLTWFGKIDGGIYSVVILGTVGAYIGGNVMQKAKEAKE